MDGVEAMSPPEVTASAVEEVYRLRYTEFLRVCTAMIGDRESGHDAVQEGFARALRSLPTAPSAGALEPWLWRVVTNTARDHMRRTTVRSAAVARKRQTSAVVGEDESGLAAALVALPDRQRMVVFLRYFADLSYDEIAEALDIRSGTVAASLNHAHAALRAALKEPS
jgi:RNA polymerase sigma factor (sigma-70 family)